MGDTSIRQILAKIMKIYSDFRGCFTLRSSYTCRHMAIKLSTWMRLMEVCRHINRLDGLHGEYGVNQKNLEGSVLQEFLLHKKLFVSNTFKK